MTSVPSPGDAHQLADLERQHGRLGDLPDQDLSLGVTHVYRRSAEGWELVHRHADPLTRMLSLDQLTTLAGG
jgi:ketosteroid isomerase-like protein